MSEGVGGIYLSKLIYAWNLQSIFEFCFVWRKRSSPFAFK